VRSERRALRQVLDAAPRGAVRELSSAWAAFAQVCQEGAGLAPEPVAAFWSPHLSALVFSSRGRIEAAPDQGLAAAYRHALERAWDLSGPSIRGIVTAARAGEPGGAETRDPVHRGPGLFVPCVPSLRDGDVYPNHRLTRLDIWGDHLCEESLKALSLAHGVVGDDHGLPGHRR
jgi:hypothetical protein